MFSMNGRISRLLLLASSAGLGACATVERQAAPVAPAAPVELQILGLNDFHGNLETPRDPVPLTNPDGTTTKYRAGGAAQLAATLKRLRTGQAETVTVAAGDLIGATPLVSAYFLDEPTIKALSMAGLDYAAVGNHEFDKGSAELKRMQDGGCEKLTTRVPCAVEPHRAATLPLSRRQCGDAGRRHAVSGDRDPSDGADQGRLHRPAAEGHGDGW